MKTIESQLDRFFDSLEHTPGPWMNPNLDYEVMTVPRGDVKICKLYPLRKAEEVLANGALVASAPAMLRTICHAYLWTLCWLPSKERNTLAGQALLAGLRSQIAESTHLTAQHVQETFEVYERQIASDNGTDY
jgi:hypothetical protein